MLARTQLIRIQKHLYEKMRKNSRGLTKSLPPAIRRYIDEFDEDLKDFEALSSKRELLINTLCSQVVLVGDYHTLPQAQRTVLKLLKEVSKFLKRKKRKAILALEMLHSRHTHVVRAYLKGELSEKSLHQAIAYDKNWGFDWVSYQRLFRFAKQEGIDIVGINVGSARKLPTLKQRDLFSAKQLAEVTAENPRALIFCLIGDLHLAPSHLPGLLEKELKRRKLERRMLTIHQNHEPFYWALVDAGVDSWIEVVRLKRDAYCILNTPPWIKLRSHLKWVEGISKEWELTDDTHELLLLLRSFFGIQSIPARFDDFEAHAPEERQFLKVLKSKKLYTAREWRALVQQLDRAGYQFFPRENHLYAKSLNPNHWSELCGRYFYAKLSGFDRIIVRPKDDPYAFVLIQAIGFLCSKVLNPKRPASHPDPLIQAGRVLGEAIYDGILRNRVSRVDVKRLLFTKFPKGSRSQRYYNEWRKRLGLEKLF